MELVGDDVRVEVVNTGSEVQLVLESPAGRAVARLTPEHALAVAAGLAETAAEVAENPGGMLN